MQAVKRQNKKDVQQEEVQKEDVQKESVRKKRSVIISINKSATLFKCSKPP